MIEVQERIDIDAPIDVVWSVLRSPETVVQCIPGAALTESREDGTYVGTLTVAFGPTKVKFQGEVALEYEDSKHLCRASSRGRDQRGMSNATGTGVFSLEPSGNGTTLQVSGGFNLTGPLAPFAKSGGPVVLRTLLSEFTKQLSALIRVRDDSTSDRDGDETAVHTLTPHPPSRETNSLSVWRLIAGIVREWLRIFTRTTNR